MTAGVSAPLTATASGVGIMTIITRTFVSVSLPVVSIGAVNIQLSVPPVGGRGVVAPCPFVKVCPRLVDDGCRCLVPYAWPLVPIELSGVSSAGVMEVAEWELRPPSPADPPPSAVAGVSSGDPRASLGQG